MQDQLDLALQEKREKDSQEQMVKVESRSKIATPGLKSLSSGGATPIRRREPGTPMRRTFGM